jgi:hypothetical protein
MTISEKIEFIWNKAYSDALGDGVGDAFAYADKKAAPYVAQLHRAERAQAQKTPRYTNLAGRRQAAARKARA